ncbi:recombination regulator RecX [Clostridium beijerinckii]|uniref:recombination regulator RecX n=1 Tax=Clostridium beijerinckii TaxID=1520 RepID=UPI00047B6B50|nr:recombination regulator RecX [Clostridium beijerinckii]
MAKITKIELQKRNKERVNLFLDGEYAFSISAELVYKESLKVNSEIDSEKLKILAESENFMRCKESALRIIERTYKTEKEVRDKLRLKEYDEISINKAIEFLEEYNFINDSNYAKIFIRDKLRTMGSQKIKYTLLRKGVCKEIINEELLSLDTDNEKNIAFDIAQKKYNLIKKKETDTYKISGKLYRHLMSKGYNTDVTSEVIKKVMAVDVEDF